GGRRRNPPRPQPPPWPAGKRAAPTPGSGTRATAPPAPPPPRTPAPNWRRGGGPGRPTQRHSVWAPPRADAAARDDEVPATRARGELEAGEELGRSPHDELEDGELLGGELELDVPPPDLVLGGVETQVANLKLRRALSVAAPGKRA